VCVCVCVCVCVLRVPIFMPPLLAVACIFVIPMRDHPFFSKSRLDIFKHDTFCCVFSSSCERRIVCAKEIRVYG